MIDPRLTIFESMNQAKNMIRVCSNDNNGRWYTYIATITSKSISANSA